MLFGVIAVIAVSGAVLLAAQERSRLRIVAEYRAFQLVADLLRSYDTDESAAIVGIEGLRAFGVYSRRGEALFRYGECPAAVTLQDVSAGARFKDGIVSFVRLVGGNPAEFQKHGGRQGLQPGMMFGLSPMGPGMGQGMGNARLVYIAYDTTALRSGERFVFLTAALVVAAVLAAFVLLFSLVRSLDEYREREAKNRELLALGEAARTLTHEIKNPLGVVKIQCALLRKTSGKESESGLRIIEEETDRIALLASRVKAFLSADEGSPRDVSVADCVASFSSRYGERLRATCAPCAASAFVAIDPLRLDQILDNLIANALESMDGVVTPVAELSADASRGRVRISVMDRGSGIAPEVGSRVFDLFFTTKINGAGIGLPLAKRYAETAGGSISHQPREGGGTVFTLDLPESRGANR